ncbi:MAG TPA: alpha/beta hydrolase fold domain-containing protein [Dongiaceae bacterium]|nr:alpha/beta hydrolase fold domain-containing protein [Dongiaceae bacterium]
MDADGKGPQGAQDQLSGTLHPGDRCQRRHPSYLEFGTGRFLARAFMKYGWDLYAPDEKTRNNPYVSPLRASKQELEGLPPALVITAENDPLRDEGEAYARKLKEAGVEVTAARYNGMIHDFVLLNAIRHVPAVESAIEQASDGIRRHLQPQ